MTKGKTSLLDRLEKWKYSDERQRKEFERRFEEFVRDEQRKAGQYEENEFGPECP